MKCHTAKNGGFMFLIIFLWISAATSSDSKKNYTIQKFCSENSYIHNIEIGDTYQLVLKSEPTAAEDKWYLKSKRKCLREYKTSNPAAHFVVDITDMHIPSCSGCRCNYFEISGLDYKKKFCGEEEIDSYSSKSDTVSVYFHHGSPQMGFDVTLTFSVERNFYTIVGAPSLQPDGGGSYLETPYFPNPYPSNYQAEYLLRSEELRSHVVLLFLDFQISNHSFIEVDGHNKTMPTRFYGSTFRPPVIVSEANQLNVKFQSYNELVRPGFRALTYFIRTVDCLSVPHTDCGGLKHGRGGNMNIVTHETFSLYDCVWHIRLPLISSTKLNTSLSVHLRAIGYKSRVEFRNGHNSKSDRIKELNCERVNCTYLDDEMVIPASSDLYIRFSGYLDFHSEVNISYSTYHVGDCSDREFTCEDGRCLLLDFQCDGVEQCPSGDDEQHCSAPAVPDIKVSVSTKKERSVQDNEIYRNFFILLLIGSFGLVAVLVAVFFLYRYRKVAPASIEQPQPRVREEMSGMMPALYSSGTDSPPSYEDFIKSSDFYPPLLYTRAKKPTKQKDAAISCTTNFIHRGRHHSANSYDRRGSDADSNRSRTSTRTSQQTRVDLFSLGLTPGHNTRASKNSIQRWYSLDSKLNDLVKQDTCHLFLSIIHPVCNHASEHPTRVQCHSLPPNFKISTTKCDEGDVVKLKEPMWLPNLLDRRCTWSFVSPPSGSGLLDVAKARCCSDPCQGVRIHYSE